MATVRPACVAMAASRFTEFVYCHLKLISLPAQVREITVLILSALPCCMELYTLVCVCVEAIESGAPIFLSKRNSDKRRGRGGESDERGRRQEEESKTNTNYSQASPQWVVFERHFGVHFVTKWAKSNILRRATRKSCHLFLRPNWFKGDAHTHTRLLSGGMEIGERIESDVGKMGPPLMLAYAMHPRECETKYRVTIYCRCA